MSESNSPQDSIAIKRAKCDSLSIYEITEWELEIIKRWWSDILLNIWIALISLFASFLVTLLTVDIASDRKYNFFLFFCIITLAGGVILMILRRRGRNDFKLTIQKIEKRMKEEEKKDISMDAQAIVLGE